MAHSYTPGLRVTKGTTVRRERKLPLTGTVVVNKGDSVERDQIVARTDLPGEVVALNLANRLGCSPSDVASHMLHQEGDHVQEGATLAETKPIISWLKTTVSSPVTGSVESISVVTGQVILRKPARPVEVQAYIPGKVIEVYKETGISVQTQGSLIQGIFGVGGETWGTLVVATSTSGELLTHLPNECEGKIIVVGRLVTAEMISKARDRGAVGLIGGGIRDQDLRILLGYDLGVAITGDEDIGITLVLTEGFGEIPIAQKTFSILDSCDGKQASISGATQIRAGVLRPEIIIPFEKEFDDFEDVGTSFSKGIRPGDLLRVIRIPFFGRIGRVSGLPLNLQRIESGAVVRVLEVEFEDGERAVVPRANVEMIEE
ncbi:MAG: hypothetical protein VX294_07080 [Candidatus Latescibacterota bacterium]|nr:hypothetical protein [Candidatus Latescibacterota bacterium]